MISCVLAVQMNKNLEIIQHSCCDVCPLQKFVTIQKNILMSIYLNCHRPRWLLSIKLILPRKVYTDCLICFCSLGFLSKLSVLTEEELSVFKVKVDGMFMEKMRIFKTFIQFNIKNCMFQK